MGSKEFVRRNFEKGKDLEYLKDKLEKQGWKNLKIGPYHRSASGIDKTEDGLCCCKDLRACPPDYKGPYTDYCETVAITLKERWEGKIVMIAVKEEIEHFLN